MCIRDRTHTHTHTHSNTSLTYYKLFFHTNAVNAYPYTLTLHTPKPSVIANLFLQLVPTQCLAALMQSTELVNYILLNNIINYKFLYNTSNYNIYVNNVYFCIVKY